MSPDLRGGAILDSDGSVLAATGRPERWREDVATLLEVADGAGGEPVEQVHIATEQGEVFALRHAGLAAIAVTERFALASLLFFDMRACFATSRGRRRKGTRCHLSRTASCSTASPATPTRRPPTCAAAASPANPSPGSTTRAGAATDHAGDSLAGAELFVAAGRLIEIAGKRPKP